LVKKITTELFNEKGRELAGGMNADHPSICTLRGKMWIEMEIS
jgi:hypothetical protein